MHSPFFYNRRKNCLNSARSGLFEAIGEMGQSSSKEDDVPPDLREVQSFAASTGALTSLQKSFSLLSDPQTKSIPIVSLQKCFDLTLEELEYDRRRVTEEFPQLLHYLGSSIVDLFFVSDKQGVNWTEFLKGYTKCCARTVGSTSFINLCKLFSLIHSKTGHPPNLKFEPYDDECKISGWLSPGDIHIILWMSWVLSRDSRLSMGNKIRASSLPDVSHLLISAIESCTDGGHDLDFWDSAVENMNIQLPAAKVQAWALNTLPNLANFFVQFVNGRLCYLPNNEANKEGQLSAHAHELPSSAGCETSLLTPGRAWAISLTLRVPIYEEILKFCFPENVDDMNENILYRSSVHGKGLNRFWANIEGYNGSLLLLISACEDKSTTRRWIIGAITHQGFQNKDIFYGTSGSLYALSPVFHIMPSTGKERNFVYSHLHPTGRVYEPHPKPVGIGFGGSIGNERIFLDEDFGRVTIRHHAVDKTYKHGALFPNQGFLAVEACVQEVEVWGLGGRKAQEVQDSYKKREQLFTEQRRKVDMKKFANWEDSPEKMMMDMMSDPNAVRREDR